MKKGEIKKNKNLDKDVKNGIMAMKEAQDDSLAEAVQVNAEFDGLGRYFKDWCILFTDKSKPEYGNATQCVLKTYPNITNYFSAGTIGSRNVKKLKAVAAIILEQNNLGYGELMKIGMAKMLKGGYGDWEALMERVGYFDPKPKGGGDTNIFNFANLQAAIIRDRKARGLEV